MMFKICLALSAVIFAVNALAPVSPELREFDAEWEAHMVIYYSTYVILSVLHTN